VTPLPPSPCRHCLAWGLIARARMCLACVNWRRWQPERCSGCGRSAPLKHGHCRLCHEQAKLQTGRMVIRETMPKVRLTAWQLFFSIRVGDRRANGRRPIPEPVPPRSTTGQIPGQLPLFGARREYLRFDRVRHANPDNPTLAQARILARDVGEARGWSKWVLREVNDGLLILLSGHAHGDVIAYSEIVPIDQLGANVGHTAEILDQLGILRDDRTPAFDAWLSRKLPDLAPAIAADVAAWVSTLRHGGPRSRPRAEDTVRNYLHAALPALADWSARYDYLREVTRADVHAVVDGMTGLPRKRALVALRSLFQFAQRTGRVFRDPTTHINTGKATTAAPLPLRAEQLEGLITHAVTPARRLILALAAVHAARPTAIRALRLDDVDLLNLRLTIGGYPRRLDDLTAQLIRHYLADRRRRWPHTANPHLLLTDQTAHDQRPVSQGWLGDQFEGAGATLNQVRMDRQLEEALSHGPDPLHLVAVFGISERAAIRYANAARQFLDTALDRAADHDGRPS